MFNRDSSPFDSSPFNNSPRLFWKERDPTSPAGRFGSENEFERDVSLSPKRSSIENLKKASRVKNSSMFAREQKNEYDPSSTPVVERPLAAGRPLSVQVQGNAYGGRGLDGLRKQNEDFKQGHRRGESLSKIPLLSPGKSPARSNGVSPYFSTIEQSSPTKSSLASNGRFSAVGQTYDPESSIWSEDEEHLKHQTPRPLRRHAKSVTFDAAPPTINEYEMVTPDPSSVASGSREGSFDSAEEFDDSFDRGSMDIDDSFDASLEDTDKTPVVLPEDWRHMSPEVANTSLADTFEDPFDGRESSPMPTARPNGIGKSESRTGSTNSEGESRPLPPLPGLTAAGSRRRRDSSIGLSSAAERASGAQRSLPTPPRAAGVSKADILNMRDSSMSLEDRLRLMGLEGRDTDTPTQESHNESQSLSRSPPKDLGLGIQVHVDEVDAVDESELEPFKFPRISRESILRKVKSRTFDDYDYDYSTVSSPERSYGDLADLDPDVPIPSREASSNFDIDVPDAPVKCEGEADNVVDAYSMTEMYNPERDLSQVDDYDRETSVIHHKAEEEPRDDDDASLYSQQLTEELEKPAVITDSDGPPTPRAEHHIAPQHTTSSTDLPDFGAFMGDSDFNLRLDSYMTTSSAKDPEPTPQVLVPTFEEKPELQPRPTTPVEQLQLPLFSSQESEDEPGTPDSVIRHPMIEPLERDSPVVPDPIATIKAPGAKLKTRPSLVPSDPRTMAAARRQVSGERAPPIPERSPKRRSMSLDIAEGDSVQEHSDGSNKENPPRRRQSNRLKLDIPISGESDDLSFGLVEEFDRVIEAQKVHLFPLPSFARFSTSTAAIPTGEPGAEYICGEGFTYQYSPTNGYVRAQKGYLMRQNTKVVVASSRQFSDEQPPMSPTDASAPAARGTRSAGSSPRKPSADRKAWTTEPWNGKVRRKSIRTASGSPKKAPTGPAPPLPGQESNVTAGLSTLVEDQSMIDGSSGEEKERGRLFVKVLGVKDLDLPLPKCKSSHKCSSRNISND
jgi:hypothetical protein